MDKSKSFIQKKTGENQSSKQGEERERERERIGREVDSCTKGGRQSALVINSSAARISEQLICPGKTYHK
jgi:hypothetical protein